jgi:hypothetical protein
MGAVTAAMNAVFSERNFRRFLHGVTASGG